MERTVQQVIDTILSYVPGAPLADTVDTVKTGDPYQPVTGIVTTFLASTAVIQKAVDLGANMIITHEPTFYNHLDDITKFKENVVYLAKRRLIDTHGIAIWRFHDHWHLLQPDGILTGLVKALDWGGYQANPNIPLFTLPEVTLAQLVTDLKKRLGCSQVRVVGDPGMVCTQVGLLPGSPGAEWQIDFLSRNGVDVLLTGEVHEWETSEFTRDAVLQGRHKGLVVLGHACSEEAGMAYLVDWLKPKLADVPIYHVPVGDAFRFL